jgi:hypothetical protein
MKRSILAIALAATCVPALSSAAAPVFTKLWTTDHKDLNGFGQTNGVTSEISAFDSTTNTLWVAGVVGVDVLNASTGTLVQHIAAQGINSVAIKNGVAAFAVESATRTDPGTVQFFDTTTRLNTGNVTVGALPDMLTFSADGSKLLVANEATPTTYGGTDPMGTVSIINMNNRTVAATVNFNSAVQSGSNLRTNVGMDFEPEYIAINAAGTKAFVGLQEANGMGVIDLTTNTATQVIGLGVKDFSASGNGIDPSHKDYLSGTSGPTKIELRSAAVKGLYQPDGMVSFEKNGQTFIVMANEGDTREDDGDKERAKDVAAFNNEPADLKQLNISTTDSTSGTDLVTFGARSFSIRDENGNIVYDSGNILDAKAIEKGIYDDGRSDDKGVEPEGVTLMELDGRTLAFVGLERTTTSAVAIFDITDPVNSQYLDMIVGAGDKSPEGVLAYSYGGVNYLAVAHEVSNTTTLYSISAPVPEADTYALMLAGMGLVGFLARRRKS